MLYLRRLDAVQLWPASGWLLLPRVLSDVTTSVLVIDGHADEVPDLELWGFGVSGMGSLGKSIY